MGKDPTKTNWGLHTHAQTEKTKHTLKNMCTMTEKKNQGEGEKGMVTSSEGRGKSWTFKKSRIWTE